MTIPEELRMRAEYILTQKQVTLAAKCMLRAADLLEQLMPIEVPVEQVATKGEE